MNWKLILVLALTGPILGLTGVYGLNGFGSEPYIVFTLFVIFAILFSIYAPGKYFLHGFITAFLFGASMSFLRLQMLERYISVHPDAADAVEGFLHKVSFIRSPMLVLLCLVIISSVIAGLLAMIAGFLRRSASRT
jgi:hypothetical protein